MNKIFMRFVGGFLSALIIVLIVAVVSFIKDILGPPKDIIYRKDSGEKAGEK